MKKLITILVASLLITTVPVITTGCKAPVQKIAYNTMYSLQQSVVGSYDAYIALVVAGKLPSTNLADVSKKFNKFQTSYLRALDVVQYDMQAFAPAELVAEAGDVVNTINTVNK